MFHSSSLIPCDAGVVAVMHQCEVRDTQGAGEVYVVYGNAQAGRDWPTILLPGDEDGLVTRHNHTGDEDSLADGKPGKLKWLDGGRDCNRDGNIASGLRVTGCLISARATQNH